MLLRRKNHCLGTSYKTKDLRSSYYCYCEKPVCQRWRIKQFAQASVGLCSFPGLYVRKFELSDRNLVNRIIKITHAHNLHVKKSKLFTRKFSQPILKNQLGFITTSAIKLCFKQRQGWYSLTFINFQENYQTVEIYFHSYHVIPFYQTICYHFVN